MARARLLKPGFFTDDAIAACQPLARILFAGLWTLADKRGRLRDQPQVIAGALLPFDLGVSTNDLLGELEAHDLILRYVVDGKRVIQVRNFSKHQHPHPKEPDSELPGPPDSATASPEQVPEDTEPAPAPPKLAVAVSPESFPSCPSFLSPSDTMAGGRTSLEETPASPPAVDESARDVAAATLDELAELTGRQPERLLAEASRTSSGQVIRTRLGLRSASLAWVTVTAERLVASVSEAKEARRRSPPGPEPWQLERIAAARAAAPSRLAEAEP